ncbi:hypothetical protein CkaCkLH20_06970 [Colletotrichum karsti]|uniref:RRM domain-containing protein n=1 Tax=Colletotrichum karsti TaxID=1095194 RepID=A0A9P6I3Y0_9PEZI|nr:uncharacterized protein CkaCkLH20_06970 [Colletotrichum karsti]KAF9875589.1 hypothetical protein CkaCkLH20_06970 [Colletotrichum karsti]
MLVGQIPPGAETGNFYIPICNLPFDTTWKSLKDWLSSGCEVDYVRLYGPTSGWIRVKGPYNFYRACDLLRDGVFDGRRIIFDDSNMTSAVVVKEIHDDENATPASVPARHRQTELPLGSATVTTRQASSSTYASSEAFYDQWIPNPSTTSQTHPNIQQQATWYPDNLPSGGFFPDNSHPYPQFMTPPNESRQTVPIEQRRIIVRRIGHNTPEDQIKALIKQCLERVTPVKAELQRIDVPRGSSSQNKGHAFATFRSADIARRVAELLNGKTWNTRRLEARLTNEGLTEEQSSRAPQSQGSGSRQRKGNDSTKKRSNERTTAPNSNNCSSGESSSSRQSRHRPPTGPVIADGTSHRAQSESKERKRR